MSACARSRARVCAARECQQTPKDYDPKPVFVWPKRPSVGCFRAAGGASTKVEAARRQPRPKSWRRSGGACSSRWMGGEARTHPRAARLLPGAPK